MSFGYRIYFTERSKNRVLRWDPDNNTTEVLAGETSGADPSQTLNDPYALAFDRNGDLLISDKLNHRLCRLNRGRLETLPIRHVDGHRAKRPDSPGDFEPDRPSCPCSLVVENSGSILCAFYDDHTIYRIHPDGRLELVLGLVRNAPYFHDAPREHIPPGEVRSQPIFCPTGLVARSDGTMFFIERQTGVVRSYHPGRGLTSVFSLRHAAKGRRMSNAPEGGRLQDYHPGAPTSLALDRGGTLYVCDPDHGSILRVNDRQESFERVVYVPRTPQSILGTGPVAVAFGPDGTAWVADCLHNVIQAYTIVASGEWPAASVTLNRVHGEPLSFQPGGMGLIVGS